jgi:hypothetical protein
MYRIGLGKRAISDTVIVWQCQTGGGDRHFTNEAITTSTTFPNTGTWYNYMNPSESLDVSSATMDITLPANSFKMYTSF